MSKINKKALVEYGIGLSVIAAIGTHYGITKHNEKLDTYNVMGKYMTDSIFITENGYAFDGVEKPDDAPIDEWIVVEMRKNYTAEDICDDYMTGKWHK